MAIAWALTETSGFVDHGYVAGDVTFSGVGIGTAASDRFVVVTVVTTGRYAGSMTIGGVSATLLAQSRNGGTREVSLWGATVTSGTTADVVITPATFTFNTIGISTGKLTGADTSPTDTDSLAWGYNADTQDANTTIPTGGIMLVAAGTESGTSSLSWDQGTEDASAAGTGTTLSSGYLDGVTGSQTVAITGANFAGCGVVAATFGPAAGGITDKDLRRRYPRGVSLGSSRGVA